MAAQWDDLDLDQGATRRFRFQYTHKTGAFEEDGVTPITTPYDLTAPGTTARMQVRAKYGTAVLIEVTTTASDDGSIELEADGWISVWLSDEATDALVKADGKTLRTVAWDIEVVWPSGDVSRVLQGTSTVSPNITRDEVLT